MLPHNHPAPAPPPHPTPPYSPKSPTTLPGNSTPRTPLSSVTGHLRLLRVHGAALPKAAGYDGVGEGVRDLGAAAEGDHGAVVYAVVKGGTGQDQAVDEAGVEDALDGLRTVSPAGYLWAVRFSFVFGRMPVRSGRCTCN